jgi:hypothetical protein
MSRGSNLTLESGLGFARNPRRARPADANRRLLSVTFAVGLRSDLSCNTEYSLVSLRSAMPVLGVFTGVNNKKEVTFTLLPNLLLGGVDEFVMDEGFGIPLLNRA